MDESSEKSLIEAAQRDPKAFGAIYDRYVERIYAFIFRRTRNHQVAEDLTAATFESALRNIKQFEWRGVGLAAWLYRIGRNKLIGHYRRQRLLTPLSVLSNRRRAPSTPSNFAEQFETNDWLINAYSQLAYKDREVIALRFFEGLTSEEAAKVLQCSKSNLYVRLHRALRRLAELLKQNGQVWEAPNEAE